MEVRVSALLRDVLGVLGFIEAICKARHLKFRVLHFRVKIEGLGFIGNDLDEAIVLRAGNIFGVIFDWTTLVYYFLVGNIGFGEPGV
jgi:hypothetical protein